MSGHIIEKYESRARQINSLLCVGLDSDVAKLPTQYRGASLPQFAFNKDIIDATHEYAAAFKLNSAFYEAEGVKGIEALKETMEYIRSIHPDIFTIIDAKRGDIGNTNSGYVTFFFDWLGADALTIHPYLGKESIIPFLERTDKCSIILAKTSNPGSGELQDLEIGGVPLWQITATKVANEWNDHGNLMIVVGGTYPGDIKKARELTGDLTFLVPGIGVQGGDVSEVLSGGRNSQGLGLIINSSRGIIFADNPRDEAKRLCEEIRTARVINN